MENKKRNLIILARTSEKDDMNFYKTVLRENSPIYDKAVVLMFSVVEQITDYLSELPDTYEFSFLIHLGYYTVTNGQDGRDLVLDMQKEYWGKYVKFEYTSREGDRVVDGIKVHHTNSLPATFDLNSLPLNRLSDLRKFHPGITNTASTDKHSQSGLLTDPSPKRDYCKFVIQTALDKNENDIFRHYMDFSQNGSMSIRGRFKKSNAFQDIAEDIVLVKQEQMGMVDAAYTASHIIHEHRPEYLLMAGVCGGRKEKVALFDIIIPSKVYDFSFGSLENGQFKQRDLDAKLDAKLIKYLEAPEVLKKIKLGMISLVDTPNEDKEKYVQNVKFHFDVMACGPWVVKTEGFLNQLSEDKNNLIRGLEMESYSIGRAYEIYKELGVRPLIVKSVMDYTDHQKENDLQNIDTKRVAGYMSYLCVRAMLPVLVDFQKGHLTK